jgi:hypothetical protein
MNKQTNKQTTNKQTKTVRWLWQEMLSCVASLEQRKVVHSDLKPANFVFFKGNYFILLHF